MFWVSLNLFFQGGRKLHVVISTFWYKATFQNTYEYQLFYRFCLYLHINLWYKVLYMGETLVTQNVKEIWKALMESNIIEIQGTQPRLSELKTTAIFIWQFSISNHIKMTLFWSTNFHNSEKWIKTHGLKTKLEEHAIYYASFITHLNTWSLSFK